MPRAIQEELHRRAKALADLLGPLPNSVIMSTRETDERWDRRTDQVPPEMTPQLATEALKQITEEHAVRGAPLPPREQLVLLVAARTNAVLYPYRRKLVSTSNPEPEQQVKTATQYARRAEKRQPAMMAPEPLPAPEMAFSEASEPMTQPVPEQPAPIDGGLRSLAGVV